MPVPELLPVPVLELVPVLLQPEPVLRLPEPVCSFIWAAGTACAFITRLQTRCVCFSVSGCMGSPSFAPLYAPRRRIVRFHKKLPVKIVIFHDFVPEKSCISRMTVLKFFFVRFFM